MKTPKFVIGIGSQRAGSTLLHRILDECTDIFMHPVKELHYFDTLHDVRHQDVLSSFSERQLNREIDRLIEMESFEYLKSKKHKCYLRTNRILSRDKVKNIDYINLFRPCILDNPIVGEITPEYMILPEVGVRNMAETIGSNARIILIKRSPTERFISAFKLLKCYNNNNISFENFETEIFEVFDSKPGWIRQQKAFNDYDNALDIYSKYFEQIMSVEYKDLVGESTKTQKSLEEFLDMPVNRAIYESILSTKINQMGETAEISQTALTKISELLNS